MTPQPIRLLVQAPCDSVTDRRAAAANQWRLISLALKVARVKGHPWQMKVEVTWRSNKGQIKVIWRSCLPSLMFVRPEVQIQLWSHLHLFNNESYHPLPDLWPLTPVRSEVIYLNSISMNVLYADEWRSWCLRFIYRKNQNILFQNQRFWCLSLRPLNKPWTWRLTLII